MIKQLKYLRTHLIYVNGSDYRINQKLFPPQIERIIEIKKMYNMPLFKKNHF